VASIPWGNEADIFIIAISGEEVHFRREEKIENTRSIRKDREKGRN